ncbi:hypothetical protein [Microbispora triticiradicis]|uniref:hypothetical protein n=1 Tax=Microbispora triticiradicis TaxID=2200763 RepID=UPI001AD70985|nr:hypothetical protein [Microbispora triticiradicis]MBO4273126.1 hypothetical protein [Microbispora triticiradicis]
MPDIAEQLPAALLEAVDVQIRADGSCPRPQVHILAEDLDAAYLGHVVCRRFYRGADAAAALGGLGVLPSVVKATRLFVLWEERDLRTALEIQKESDASALVIVDARFDGHTLHWHPFNARLAPASSGREPAILVQWDTPARYENVPLPPPIESLLQTWRELWDDDLERTAVQLQEAGYELYWAMPSDKSHD